MVEENSSYGTILKHFKNAGFVLQRTLPRQYVRLRAHPNMSAA
jgi:hypothetical protein